MARWVTLTLAVAAAACLAATMEIGAAHAEGVGFKFRNALVRIITPNNDHKNDVAILCYENAADAAVNAKIFDLKGQIVAEMQRIDAATVTASYRCPPATVFPAQVEALTWNGLSSGAVVDSGVYIYRIQCEGRAVTGTILVVR
ncbi:MAG: hypothetical protein A2X36_00740 [Elusimicrobia bacterium GWA2_69_24]|nr:MAG: hypothetical protein A2X36_00740 [Elusimicrobia bacterium GWA2_69_24]HBL15676.1 hypothetical protein [Elusimicrobiota bacterium]